LHCTTEQGIQLTPEYELAYFDHAEARETIEHELVRCEICGTVVAPAAQLEYIFNQLKTLVYANPTVYLTYANEQGLKAPTAARDERPVGRWDIMRILCPQCRRNVLLKEEWG
jgi:hydrogenase-4 component H